MAGINLQSERVLGINVANRGVANLPGQGYEPAVGQTPMYRLSQTLHLVPSDTDLDTASRQKRLVTGVIAAKRAGRSEGCAGVTLRQSSARFAGRAIPFGWPGFERTFNAAAAGDPGKVNQPWQPELMSSHSQSLAQRTIPLPAGPESLASETTAPIGPKSGMFRSVAIG